jgi:hemerythrin superfamily protein
MDLSLFQSDLHKQVGRHHHELDRLLTELCEQARLDDPKALRRFWTRFERELAAHLRYEEMVVIPSFAAEDPGEAAELLREHDEIRRLVDDLGVGVDLHLVDAGIAADLARRLHDHAAHEERVLYPWARKRSR